MSTLKLLAVSLLMVSLSFLSCVEAARSSSASLQQYLSSIPASEPHHVCMTGNRAQKLMESFVMLEGHQLSRFEMKSKLNPDTLCNVHDYKIANTLFLMGDDLPEACAARWKVHSASCDVLVHAHDGKDCDLLYKFRMITDQCEAPMVVIHSNKDLMNCYNDKLTVARKNDMMPLDEHCTTVRHSVLLQKGHIGNEVVPAIRSALQETASLVKERYSDTKVNSMLQHTSSPSELRHVLQSGKRSVHDIHIEFMRHMSHMTSDEFALSLLQSSEKLKVFPESTPNSILDMKNGSGNSSGNDSGDDSGDGESFGNPIIAEGPADVPDTKRSETQEKVLMDAEIAVRSAEAEEKTEEEAVKTANKEEAEKKDAMGNKCPVGSIVCEMTRAYAELLKAQERREGDVEVVRPLMVKVVDAPGSSLLEGASSSRNLFSSSITSSLSPTKLGQTCNDFVKTSEGVTAVNSIMAMHPPYKTVIKTEAEFCTEFQTEIDAFLQASFAAGGAAKTLIAAQINLIIKRQMVTALQRKDQAKRSTAAGALGMCTLGAVIIDSGSGSVKIGCGDEKVPKLIIDSIVGYPKYPYVDIGRDTTLTIEDMSWQGVPGKSTQANSGRNEFTDIGPAVGHASEYKVYRGVTEVQYPMKHGIVVDWPNMKHIWTYALKQMKYTFGVGSKFKGLPGGFASGDWKQTQFDEHCEDCDAANVMLAETPLNPKNNRERMVNEFLNFYEFKGVYVGVTAVLALFGAVAKTQASIIAVGMTGLVVDVGHGVTHITPIVEGYALPHAIKRLDVAGHDLTKYMGRMLSEESENVGRYFISSAELEIAKYIKEKLGYTRACMGVHSSSQTGKMIAPCSDWSAEVAAYKAGGLDITWYMPDLQPIKVSTQRWRVVEPLFDPRLIGVEETTYSNHGTFTGDQNAASGIPELIVESVSLCDVDTRMRLYQNIIISGGSAVFGNFGKRIENEVVAFEDRVFVTPVVVNQGRKQEEIRDYVWHGMATISQNDLFKNTPTSPFSPKQLWYTKVEHTAGVENIWRKKGMYALM